MTFHALPACAFFWNDMAERLELVVKRPLRPIPESEWGWKSEAAALASMITTSGLQEKTVAIEAEIDASTLAKVKQGTARPSEDSLDRMMDATGSEAWLLYWLLKRGYDPHSLRKLETETERALREEREAHQRARDKISLLTDLLQGKTPA
jgi:cell division septum initiation protein DivIVA